MTKPQRFPPTGSSWISPPGGETTATLAGGQSGHPLSRDYANQIGAWQRVDPGHPLLLERAAIEREARATLRLLPERPGAS